MAGHYKLVQNLNSDQKTIVNIIGIGVSNVHIESYMKLTKSYSQVNYDIFSIKKNHHIMKDFKDMTLEEKEEILEQIRNLPEHEKEDGNDSFDLFTQSFSEISKKWSDSLKEFDALYPDYLIDEDNNPLEKYESKWTAKIRKKLF